MNDNELQKRIMNNLLGLNYNLDSKLLVSGRSAIDFAIKDLIQKKGIENAVLPDYICEPMVEPFIKNSINVKFYSVKCLDKEFIVDYDDLYNLKNNCVLVCDYFYSNNKIYNNIAKIVHKSNYIIHDITHTLLSGNVNTLFDQYTVCSLRKVFETLDGGLVIGKNSFQINTKGEHTNYIKTKSFSKQAKKEYYDNPTSQTKKLYQYYYNLADEILNGDYSCYSMSQKSINQILDINFSKLKYDKCNLFNEIYQLLKNKNIETIKNINKNNCLFTIPIIVKNRDEVLEKFYNNLIKCAVFWEYNKYNKDQKNEFIDNGICLSINQNTSKQLKKILK